MDKKAKESARALQAFDDYYSMGAGRSYRKLVAKYSADLAAGKLPPTHNLHTLSMWSQKFGWVERIMELEEEERRTKRAARIKNIESMEKRQSEVGAMLQSRTIEFLKIYSPTSLSDALRLLETGVSMERNALLGDSGSSRIAIDIPAAQSTGGQQPMPKIREVIVKLSKTDDEQ